jgi:hypothetical protein
MRAATVTALVLGGLLVASAAAAQVIQITTNIAANTSWGPTGSVPGTVFWVRNNIAINAGVTLNIQPGVIVKFDQSRTLTVNGNLKAIGTAPSNIYFTSYKDDALGGDTNGDGNTTPAASDWIGIQFPDGSPDFGTRLDYCDIRFAGAANNAALQFASASDTVSNSVIRRSYYGVDCAGTAAPVLVNTSIEAATLTPIVLDFTAAPVFSSLVFSTANNGYDAFGLRGATLTTGQSATLPKRGATVGANPVPNVTYVLLGSLTINTGASLTINPGVVIKPSAGYSITVNGNLTMNGTAATGDTMTITSIHDDNFGTPGDTDNNGSVQAPARGDWNRIVFSPGATGSLSRCRLKFGSNSATQGLVEMTDVSIPVSNSLLTDSGHGLALFGQANPAVSNVGIQNCSSTPVLLSVSANPAFTNLTFLANAITAVGLEGENIAVDSRIPVRSLGGFANITYYLMNGTLVMQSPAVLRIDPGIVIKNQLNGGGIQIDGALVADGKVDSVIVFTSERDDTYGNPADTNGDGGSTSPAQGNWPFIRLTAGSNDAVSKLDYCRIAYGSYGPFDGWTTSLWLQSAAPPITNCTITKGSWGIRMDGDSSPLIDGCTFTNLQNAPYVMSVVANPNITANNTYSTNGYNAIGLTSEDVSGTARIRYRPGVGTPTFAYLPTGTISIPIGATLSIDPQVVLKPSSTFTLFSVNGALNIVGSNNTTGRVVITSRKDDTPSYGGDTTPNDATAPQAGDWGNILYNDTSVDGACVVRNALLTFGGSGGNDGGVLSTVSASPRFVNLEFFQNATAFTFAGTSQPVVDTTSILNCTQLPIVASLISNPQFPHPGLITLANNAYTCFGILDETVSQDVRTRVRSLGTFSNIAYCPSGTISIAFGSKWTIDPGVVIKLGRLYSDPIGITINIDGALVADGKPDSLIVFTSSADDAFGNDIRSDGALTTPAAGQWNSIQFNAISNDAVSVLDNVRIRYGGTNANGALRFISAGPPVTNSSVSITSGYGVHIEGDATPSFTNVNVDSSTNVPVLMSLVSRPTFTNVQFLGNTYTALGVITETLAQDVRWPIRAVSGRNNMPYLVQGALTVGLNSILTMQPGVIVKFTSSGSIFVQRGMTAQGRSVEPESLIVFTSYRDDFYGGDIAPSDALAPAAGDWNYVTIDGTAIDAQCLFRNCVFRYGGSGTTQGALRCVNSLPTVDSTLFAYNTVGISVEGASNPAVHGSSFVGNTQFAINNTGNSFCVNAEGNWWGAASGPNDNSATADLCGSATNAGAGDKVSNNVDYQPFATTGILNPLIGDVSLNGQVLAYDASLILQYLVTAVTLNPLQLSVADVSGSAGVTAFDASLILQYVAGVIPAFPAVSNLNQGPPASIASARRLLAHAQCCATVTLGAPYRDGADWIVPVRATADQPMYGFELRLAGATAGALTAVEAAGGAVSAFAAGDGEARVAVATVAPLPNGEVARLRFAAGAKFDAPLLGWARVNESEAAGSVPTGPAISFLAAPAPNPAHGAARLRLAIAARDAGTSASVRVLDVSGRSVRTLVSGPLGVGVHDLTWDLADEAGRPVAAGLYFIRADAGPIHATHRLIVVR